MRFEEALSSFGNADGQDAILFAEPRELLAPALGAGVGNGTGVTTPRMVRARTPPACSP